MKMSEEYTPREDKIEQAINYLRDEVIGMTKGYPEKRHVHLEYLTKIGRLISERYTWG